MVPMLRKLRLLAAIPVIAFAPLAAQNNSAPGAAGPRAGRAQIVGVVIDSLNGGFLSGASIMIDGMQMSAETDSLGRFSFDSLPSGTFQLGVFHPRLDTLSLSIVTRPFHVGPDSTTGGTIRAPPAATLPPPPPPARGP